MANSIPQKYPVGYGLGGSGVAVDEHGLNIRLGGRCLGGARIVSTGSSPVYIVVNARIVGARFTDDYRIIPTVYKTGGAGTGTPWQQSFNFGAGKFIAYDSSIANSVVTYSNSSSRVDLGINRSKNYQPSLVKMTFGLSSGSYALSLDAAVDPLFVTSYLSTISTSDALVLFPNGYNETSDVYSMDPAYEFPIYAKLDDNSLVIDSGNISASGLKLPPYDTQTGTSTALILREVSSTNTDDKFAWYSSAYALKVGFPLNPGEHIDLVSDPMIPQIFGISAITDVGQSGAVSMLQTRF